MKFSAPVALILLITIYIEFTSRDIVRNLFLFILLQDEFCTYMQLEYAEKEDSLLRSKQLHFILPAISVSILHHKSPIFRLLFIHDTTTYLCAGQVRIYFFSIFFVIQNRTSTVVSMSIIIKQYKLLYLVLCKQRKHL